MIQATQAHSSSSNSKHRRTERNTREAINQQLPVPYEMLNQVDFVGYEMFLHRTIDAVKPIIKLDRLYPDPIAFRIMW